MADLFTLTIEVQGSEELVKLQGLVKGVGAAGQAAERSLEEAAKQTRAIQNGFHNMARVFREQFRGLTQAVQTLSAEVGALQKKTVTRPAGQSALDDLKDDADAAKMSVKQLKAEYQKLYEAQLTSQGSLLKSTKFFDDFTEVGKQLRRVSKFGVQLSPVDKYLLDYYNQYEKLGQNRKKALGAFFNDQDSLRTWLSNDRSLARYSSEGMAALAKSFRDQEKEAEAWDKRFQQKQEARLRERAQQAKTLRDRFQNDTSLMQWLNPAANSSAYNQKMLDNMGAFYRKQEKLAEQHISEMQRLGVMEGKAKAEMDADFAARQKAKVDYWVATENEVAKHYRKVLDADNRFLAQRRTAQATASSQLGIVEQARRYLAASAPLDEVKAKFGELATSIALSDQEYERLRLAATSATNAVSRGARDAAARTEELAAAATRAAVAFRQLSAAERVSAAVDADAAMRRGTTRTQAIGRFGLSAVELSENATQMYRLQKEAESAAGSVNKFRSETDRTRRPVQDHIDSVNHAAAAYGALHSGMRGAAGSMGLIWLTWGKPLAALWSGFLAAGAVRESIRTYAEFEHQLHLIQGIAETTSESIKEVAKTALELGRGGLYNPTEIVQGVGVLARAGLSVDEAKQQVGTVSRFSTAGEMKMPDAAQSLIGIASAFGRSSFDLASVGDVIAKGAAISQTSIENMTSAIRVSSVVAEQYGASLEEVSGILATLAARNIEATMAGTALRNAYNEVYSPTEKASRVFKQLGISAYDSATGQMKPFLQVMKELKEVLGSFTTESQNKVFAILFGERGGKVASAIFSDIAAVEERIKKVGEAGGYVTNAALVIESSIKGRAIGALNALKAAFIDAGEASAGSMSAIVRELRQLAMSDEARAAISGLVSTFAALVETLLRTIDTLAILVGVWIGSKLIGAIAGAAGSLLLFIKQFGVALPLTVAWNMALNGQTLSLTAVAQKTREYAVAAAASATGTTAMALAANAATPAIAGLGVAVGGLMRVLGPLMVGLSLVSLAVYAAGAAWDTFKGKKDAALRGSEAQANDFADAMARRLSEEQAKYETGLKALQSGKTEAPTTDEIALARAIRDRDRQYELQVAALNAQHKAGDITTFARDSGVKRAGEDYQVWVDARRAEMSRLLGLEAANKKIASAFQYAQEMRNRPKTGDKTLKDAEALGRSYNSPLGTELQSLTAYYKSKYDEAGRIEDRNLRILEAKRRANLISEEQYDEEYDALMERRVESQVRWAREYQDTVLPEYFRKRAQDIKERHGADPKAFLEQTRAFEAEQQKLREAAARDLREAQADASATRYEADIRAAGRARDSEQGMQDRLSAGNLRDAERRAAQLAKLADLDDKYGYRQALQEAKESLNPLTILERETQQRILEIRRDYATEINDAQSKQEWDYVEQLKEAQEAAELVVVEQMLKRQQARESERVGILASIVAMQDEIVNVASSVGRAFTNAFTSAEEAFVNFVRTGKFSMRSLVDSIMADLARLAWQQMVSRPLLGFVKGLFPMTMGQEADAYGFGKAGGLVGTLPTKSGYASWFAGARHYNNGGLVLRPDEVPIIAHRGERVLNAQQNREWERGSDGVVVNQTINVQGGASTQDLVRAMNAAKEQAKQEIMDAQRRNRSRW